MAFLVPLFVVVCCVCACASGCSSVRSHPGENLTQIRLAHLAEPSVQGDAAFADIRSAFRNANPGYDLAFLHDTNTLAPSDTWRIAFVQDDDHGEDVRYVNATIGDATSPLGMGDIVLLRPNAALNADGPIDFLIVTVAQPWPDDLPSVIRPDWDASITDTPGGCATEEGAYRRVALTWLPANGAYIYHGLNAHRVRITDSFTHYHPIDGGFDEFYLVQMAQPNARIIVSEQTDRIVAGDELDVEEIDTLLTEIPLEVGDLIYLPRGTIHRGVGGVLAHVITVPGFRPGAEIGVDHLLRQINERLELEGADALPYNVEASAGPVIR